MPMACFDHLVGSNQVHSVWRDPMIPDQGMKANDGFNLFRVFFFGRRENLLAILHAAFNEDGQGCSGHHPMTVARHVLEPGAIGSCRRQQTGTFEIPSAEAQPFHHRQEEFRMRFP